MTDFDPYHKWLGVPPEEQPPNHYRLLGIPLFESDADVIDKAAEQKIAYVRSCNLGPHADTATRILNELAAAHVCLLNAEKKERIILRLPALTQAEREIILAGCLINYYQNS